MTRRMAFLTSLALAAGTALGSAPAGAVMQHPPIVWIGANKSTNWSGYNVGALTRGKLFHSIGGTWTVPRATQHTKGRAEDSATWLGIGGGCADSGCVVTDATLIQEGTEQDVGAKGKTHYYAWWEVIPAPGVTITSLKVHPGDRIRASIAEVVPNSNVWRMKMRDTTTGHSWSQTIPYTSSHDTAEWIEETPIVIARSGVGMAVMPNLTTLRFDHATLNGRPAGLSRGDRINLVDHQHVATPSAPDPDHDGFNDCTYASFCPAPGTS
jgi:hypothetical protein